MDKTQDDKLPQKEPVELDAKKTVNYFAASQPTAEQRVKNLREDYITAEMGPFNPLDVPLTATGVKEEDDVDKEAQKLLDTVKEDIDIEAELNPVLCDEPPTDICVFENEIAALRGEITNLHNLVEFYKEKAVSQDIIIFEMRALLQSGKGLGNILNLKNLLETFMAVVRERYSSVNSSVLLYDDLDPTQEFYQVKAYYGIDDYYTNFRNEREEMYLFKFPKDNGLLWQIIQQGNVFSVRDMQKDPRFRTAWEKWNLDVLKSDIWCPLIRSGIVLGILTLGEKKNGTQIQENEYHFLQELSSIAATNIDSTLKYEKNERILRNIQTLYDVNQQLANVNDFKRLCIETLTTAIQAVQAQKGNLMLFNPQTQRLEIKVVWGNIPQKIRDDINNGIMQTQSFELGQGVSGKCALEKKPIRVNGREKIEQVGRNVVYSICSVPLLYGEQIVGVINMTNKVKYDESGNMNLDPIGRYTEEDLRLLLGLADQAAVNIHKAKLYNASITDRLTGLYNTSYFEEIFTAEFDASLKTGKVLTLAISDIDHFKNFNDTYGHKAGDEVLKTVAKIFESCARSFKSDISFRYGGEEFCMLLPDTPPDEALEVIEQFRKRVEATTIRYDGKELKVTVSIGLACSIIDTDDQKELFKLADKALYSGKEGGRNQVRIYLRGLNLRYDKNLDEYEINTFLASRAESGAGSGKKTAEKEPEDTLSDTEE